VRIATREPTKVEAWPGVDLVTLDLAAPSMLEPALDGIDAVYLMWPFFQSGEAARERADSVAEILADRVQRVVYLSSQAAVEQPHAFWAVVERALEGTVGHWTMLRPTGFAVNAQMWTNQIRSGDVVRWPFGQAARSLIHECDIAAIGAALGRDLRWEELDRAQAERELDLPAEMLDAWESFIAHPEPVTDEVQRLTGEPARSFASWARDHVADFSPDPPVTA
jgi:uncharacterized protein YbjT (DUF2867 family)